MNFPASFFAWRDMCHPSFWTRIISHSQLDMYGNASTICSGIEANCLKNMHTPPRIFHLTSPSALQLQVRPSYFVHTHFVGYTVYAGGTRINPVMSPRKVALSMINENPTMLQSDLGKMHTKTRLMKSMHLRS